MIKDDLHGCLQTDLQMGTLVTSTLCIVTSEITETVDAEIEISLLIVAAIKRGELTTNKLIWLTKLMLECECWFLIL